MTAPHDCPLLRNPRDLFTADHIWVLLLRQRAIGPCSRPDSLVIVSMRQYGVSSSSCQLTNNNMWCPDLGQLMNFGNAN